MRESIKRFITAALTMLICITCLPLNALALDVYRGNNTTEQSSDLKQYYSSSQTEANSELTVDIRNFARNNNDQSDQRDSLSNIISHLTLSPIAGLPGVVEVWEEHQARGTNKYNDTKFGLVELLNDSAKPEELERALYDSSLFLQPVKNNETRISTSYSILPDGTKINRDNMDGLVVLSTYLFESNSGKGVMDKYLTEGVKGTRIPGKDIDCTAAVIYIKSGKDDLTKSEVILRYYFYNESASTWAANGLSPEDNTAVYMIEYDLTKMIQKYVADNTDLTKYPLVNQIVVSYKKYYEEILKGQKELQKKLFDGYTSKTNPAFGSIPAIKYFQDAVVKGSTDGLTKPTWSNDYDYITGSMYLKALQRAAVFEFTEENILDVKPYNETDGFSTNPEVNAGFKGNSVDLLKAVSEANAIADKYNRGSNKYNTKSLESNASIFYDLIKYRYGILSKVDEQTLGNSADKRIVSPVLDGMLYDVTDLKGMVLNPNLWDQFPNLTMFTHEWNLGEMMSIFTALQKLEGFASADCPSSGLEPVSEGSIELTNKALDQYLTANPIDDTANPPVVKDANIARLIKAYRQIDDGLKWLGIVPWTQGLQYICDSAKAFKDYKLDEELDSYDGNDEIEPLKRFFSLQSNTLSTNYLTGVALSATYIPMQTNLYDPTSIRVLKNNEWLGDFHIKYGFYRKALMIDTNVNAAVDLHITGSKDTARPAMLRDLLEYNKDIVLYVDDNFYNTPEVAEMTNKAYERLSNSEEAGMGQESLGGVFDNTFNNSIEHVLKTGPRGKYDQSTIDIARQYNEKSDWFGWSTFIEDIFTNGIIMSQGDGPTDKSGNDIKKGLEQDEYSIKQSYAVVSGIYRDRTLANYLNVTAANIQPVFVSSPALYAVNGVNTHEFNSIYNYYMLRNLEKAIGVDYKTTLDLDNPIYTDIYGNIITESGLVVIPAASNATLYPSDFYSTYTLGFMDLYSNGDNIDTTNEEVIKKLQNFTLDEKSGLWLQNNVTLNGVIVNPRAPSVANKSLLEVLYDSQVVILNDKGYDMRQRTWLITEVLRGAPLENINKEQEGIVGKRDISKYGLYMSWKLDEIADMLLPTTNGNSLISMPNLAFMDGVEYVILFAFKFMLLLFVAYIMYQTYIDAVGGKLGLKTLWKCVSTIIVFCLCIAAIPAVISLSYNETNKVFLQDEIKYINLLNYEKDLEGREISAVGVTEPKSQTKLYLKLDTITVPWYKVLQDVMFAPVGTTLDKLYEEELQKNMLYGFDDVQVVNDGVYMDVEDIFKSSSIIYAEQTHILYQNMNSQTTASFYMPYYYIMDNLLERISSYNNQNEIINITTKIQSDGSVRTMGMIGDYLLSEEFLMNSVDPLGLYTLYGINTNEKTEFVTIEDEELSTIRMSAWFAGDYYSAEDCSSRIDEFYSYMKSYVAENREMIGRVTDETFVKTMMLDLSMKYNNLFRIQAAKGIEVFSIDSRDLIRLSLTDKNTAITNSAHSFGKFVYEQSGGMGVILTAILLGVFFIASIVKPALVIFLCLLLIYNIMIKRMISMEKGKTVEGLLYVLAILVIINGSYALLLKLSMSLPNLGFGATVSIIGQIAIQAIYLWFTFMVVGAIFKDMGNFGFNVFNTGAIGLANKVSGGFSSIRDKAMYSHDQQQYMESAKLKNESRGEHDSSTLREEMERRDRKREEAQEEQAFLETVFGEKNRDRDRNN